MRVSRYLSGKTSYFWPARSPALSCCTKEPVPVAKSVAACHIHGCCSSITETSRRYEEIASFQSRNPNPGAVLEKGDLLRPRNTREFARGRARCLHNGADTRL